MDGVAIGDEEVDDNERAMKKREIGPFLQI